MNRDRSFFRRATDVLALFFGLAALAAQAIAPICLSAFPPSSSTGGSSVVLCTAHGFETVRLDANGRPAPASPDRNAPDGQCPMCVAFHAAVPLLPVAAAMVLLVLFRWRWAESVVEFFDPPQRRAYSSFITRGPPAAVRLH